MLVLKSGTLISEDCFINKRGVFHLHGAKVQFENNVIRFTTQKLLSVGCPIIGWDNAHNSNWTIYTSHPKFDKIFITRDTHNAWDVRVNGVEEHLTELQIG